jgi:Xaa-Pro dipeptidase
MYLFGLEERNCYGVIEIDTGKQVVFIPRLSEDYKMWMIVRTK